MDRFTFNEIKSFDVGINFWAKNSKWTVMDTPIYYSNSMFYGDFSEKIEFLAYNEKTMRSEKFVIHNICENQPTETLIFKVPVSENIEGTSNG